MHLLSDLMKNRSYAAEKQEAQDYQAGELKCRIPAGNKSGVVVKNEGNLHHTTTAADLPYLGLEPLGGQTTDVCNTQPFLVSR